MLTNEMLRKVKESVMEMTTELQFSSLKVWLLPCLTDNYIFVFYNSENQNTIVVDPADGLIVEKFLKFNGLCLNEIWVTHHHADHIGGVLYLRDQYSCEVRGSTQIKGRIPGVSISVNDVSEWSFGHFKVQVLELPGHTHDHIGYWLRDEKESLLFSGDVLFGLGCGRLFEGTYEQMMNSLKKIMDLPEGTQVFCAHEYTKRNLDFTLEQKPHDLKIEVRKNKILNQMQKHLPTVPLTLKEEIETNLFLRAINSANSLAEFRSLRELRNHF